MADTALKTANSGYLTRRLVDVAQDVVVTEQDCGSDDGLEIHPVVEGGEVILPIGERVLGRMALENVVDPADDSIIVEAGQQITEEHIDRIDSSAVEKVMVRSALTCKARRGVCVHCYGRDLARGKMVNPGEAVGIIAAPIHWGTGNPAHHENISLGRDSVPCCGTIGSHLPS